VPNKTKNNMAYLEPVLGGLAAFLLGFAWYTALFGKAWQAETGITDEQAQEGMVMTHGLSLLMMIIISYGINYVINLHESADQTFVHGAFHGILSCVLYGLPLLVVHYLYQKKSLKLLLIDGGYALAFFALSGGVMAALNLG
jgi:hypothetical protein